MLFSWQSYTPWQQFADPVYRPVCEDVQGMVKVTFGIYSVQFACAEQAVQQRTTLSSMIRPKEQPVFSTQTHQPQGIFSDIIIRFGPAVVRIVCQRRLLVQRVRERLCQLRVSRQGFHLFTQPAFQGFQQWFRFQLTFSKPLFCRHSLTSASMAYSSPIRLRASSIRVDGVRTCTSWILRRA